MATPQYIKDAQNTYNAKFDLVQLKLPKGTKERIKAVLEDNMSMARYCVQSVLTALESDEDFIGVSKTDTQDPIQSTQKAEISHEKEEIKGATKEPEKPLEPTAITFNTEEELNSYVLKKQAENKARHEAEAQQVKQKEEQEQEIPEQPLYTDAEDAEIDRRLKQTLAYREQVKKEREIYGEFTPEIIHEFVTKVGEELRTAESKARIVEKFGQVNYDSLIAYMDSKKI